MDSGARGDQDCDEATSRENPSRRRRKLSVIASSLVAMVVAALAVAWLARERIADAFLSDQIAAYDLPATYTIESIGSRRQVLSNLVIGDPATPDFTARRVVVTVRYRLGLPTIGSVTLHEPRIYGSYRKGELSFGSLDRVIFAESERPPELPELDVRIRDGRGLIETDWGPVGLKAEGRGNLRNGFAGIIAATAPQLSVDGCDAQGTTIFGRVMTSRGRPSFDGPARLKSLVCERQGLALSDYAIGLEASLDEELANPAFEARIDGKAMRYSEVTADGLTGSVRGQMQAGSVSGRFSLAGRGVSSPQLVAALLTVEGQARGPATFDRFEVESQVEGNGLRLGAKLEGAIDGLAASAKGTLLAPLARQFGQALRAETRGSALAADLRLRLDGERLVLLVPTAELRGGSDARIASLSQIELVRDGEAALRISGNIATGGRSLPHFAGRMARRSNGSTEFRLSMDRYVAGGSSLAIPRMVVKQAASGAVRFVGQVEGSGPLPGGSASNLRLPIEGTWASGGGLALWNSCTDVGFDRLELANLRFERRSLLVCPPRGKPILSTNAEGSLRIAAGLPALDLEGHLGETPIKLASGPIGFAYPGVMSAKAIEVTLGPRDIASTFRIAKVDARFGKDIAGTFDDTQIKLHALPLDLGNAVGRWDYTSGILSITDASFRLTDRERPERFAPLTARGATLTLRDNVIDAQAELRHPASDRMVAAVDIGHNLATASGHADLAVPGLVFDKRLQPDELSNLALGVIANAAGTISGKGRFDWTSEGIITSSGLFGSEELDFAAAFGPVKGVSGQVEFTDLINLTTRPGQKLYIASINPGVEVFDGEIEFAFRDGRMLAVAGGSWPFMGGRLFLRSVDFNFGVSEERRYIFEIVGLDAPQVVQQLELENISATGVFDGTVPIVFDASGNGRIETGMLISRPPGGNLSYVGELTYEDLSPIANFAFDALRSLDYQQMRVIMEGPLSGEIVTRVRFDGVSQGAGTKSNFVTRQLASLPLQFRINIKAQFYQLLTSLKSLYDPAAVRDPRELGLLSDDGKRFIRREISGEEVTPKIEPEDLIPNEPAIQPQESERDL